MTSHYLQYISPKPSSPPVYYVSAFFYLVPVITNVFIAPCDVIMRLRAKVASSELRSTSPKYVKWDRYRREWESYVVQQAGLTPLVGISVQKSPELSAQTGK